LRDKWKKVLRRLIFSAYVAAFCFVAGEIVVRVFYKYFADFNMEMWRYASELKQPLPYEKLPFHHVPNKQGHYYGVEIKTNSLGFRDYEYGIEKPKGKKRIVMLGDSFTLGWGVPFGNTCSKVLEMMLNQTQHGYEVINMGTGNYNSTMEVELFKLKGLQLNPDMVILMYFVNDTEPVPRRKGGPGYAAVKHSYCVSFLMGRFIKLRSRLVNSFEWSNYYNKLYSPENLDNIRANEESIKELIALCKKNEIELLIVSIPELRNLTEYGFVQATEHIRVLAEEGQVPFLDLLGGLAEHTPESLWVKPEDPHANAKANAVMAQQLYDRILDNGGILGGN